MRQRRLIAVLGLVLAFMGTGCTQNENFLWNLWHHEAPAEAEAFVSTLAPGQVFDGVPVLTPEETAAIQAQIDALMARTPCERADDMIDSAGLPDHFHGVMRRESGCDPQAYNRSGASGLLQVMPMWADDCGTTTGDRAAGTGLFNAWTNILCGVLIYGIQGGGAWQAW